MGRNTEGLIFKAADINGDGVIRVDDLSGEVNLVLGRTNN